MNTIVIITVGVLSIATMVSLDAFITRDLEKPAKEKKNKDDLSD